MLEIGTDLRAALDANRSRAQEFLCELIARPSESGEEQAAMEVAAEWFRELGADVDRVPLPPDLLGDVDYSDPKPGLQYEDRHNLRVCRPGTGGGRGLLLNTHLDIVPASVGQEDPFRPRVADGTIFGRGACDAKGQAATLYLLLAALRDTRMSLAGDLIVHLVVEEEVGGNGTLAMIRRGEEADGCIVMEPTDFKVYSSVRGAVWFELKCHGRAGHSGSAGQTVSALKMAIHAIEVLEDYHARLLAASRGIPLFDQFENPMPITFGQLEAGNWPAAAPSEAVVRGVLGLLPNKTWHEVTEEMREALARSGDEYFRGNFDLRFMYRHDAHVVDPEHPLPAGLVETCRDVGVPTEISAMTASCDSWFYNNQLGIPTVVFGPGSLGHAHSKDEQIAMDDIHAAAATLATFAGRWCG